MTGDLHTHSTFSDAACQIETLPWLAARAGVTHLAVSDHDTLCAIDYAAAHPVVHGVTMVPATELTAFDTERSRRVHILCYLPNRTQELADFCALMAQRRNTTNDKNSAVLQKRYAQFDAARARSYAADSGVLYKTHLMRVLLDFGYTSELYGTLYKELFLSAAGGAMQDPPYETLDTVLGIIHRAGGVAVLAHPTVYHSMELAAQLAQEGRIDGVEIDHPRNSEEDKATLHALAKQYDLIVTGGTDFHGMYSARPVPLGTQPYRTDEENLQRLLALAAKKKEQLLADEKK